MRIFPMQIRPAALAFLLAAAASAVADTPATQPTAPMDEDTINQPAPAADGDHPDANPGNNDNRPGQRIRRFMDGVRNFRGGGFGGPGIDYSKESPPTDDEWDKVSSFCQENFPNRWKLYERVRDARGEDAPLVQGIKLRFTVRYRQLMKVQNQADGSLYDAALEQGKLEDNCWGILSQLQATPNDQQLHQQLHDAVAELVKNQMAERERRLAAAKQALDDEEQRFKNDQHNVSSIINMRTERLTMAAGDFNAALPATLPSQDNTK